MAKKKTTYSAEYNRQTETLTFTLTAKCSPDLIEGLNKQGKPYRILEVFNFSEGWGGSPVTVKGLEPAILKAHNNLPDAIPPELTMQMKITASLDKMQKKTASKTKRKKAKL